MKKLTLILYILLSNFISGCEDSTAENDISKSVEQNKTIQKSESIVVKKQDVSPRQVETVTKKPLTTVNVEVQKNSGSKPLDLSLPISNSKTLSIDNTSIQEKPNYLPNLFKDKKTNLDIEGKIIRKHEEELHKYKAEDGVGVDLKLSN